MKNREILGLVNLTQKEQQETAGGWTWLKAIPVIGTWIGAIIVIGSVIEEIGIGISDAAAADCNGVHDDQVCN
jgi:hypothetical protein